MGAVILLSMMLTPSIRPSKSPPNAADRAAEAKPYLSTKHDVILIAHTKIKINVPNL